MGDKHTLSNILNSLYLVLYILSRIKGGEIMSFPEFTASPISRDGAIADILESIALEEAGLAHILNAEGEAIQLIGASTEIPDVNASVNSLLKTVFKIQALLQFKLEEAGSLT